MSNGGEMNLWYAAQAVVRAAGEQQHDAFGTEPARGEAQRFRRGAVEPLDIVDQAQHRLGFCQLGQKRQRRQTNQESIRRPRRADEPECGAQGIGLRRRECLQEILVQVVGYQ
ncbi:hypothetical protein GCM10010198_06830 [Nocardia seriolae]|nr:hypothetical protein NSERKGN1266_19020 [Nocardia seriolae]BEK98111.1 hypothetical protein NSER024013_60170 [Nocardia seriolae]GEM27080.1 hypothetical protein NS2_53190 [Nocardia seriolae NBRC 15557]